MISAQGHYTSYSHEQGLNFDKSFLKGLGQDNQAGWLIILLIIPVFPSQSPT